MGPADRGGSVGDHQDRGRRHDAAVDELRRDVADRDCRSGRQVPGPLQGSRRQAGLLRAALGADADGGAARGRHAEGVLG